jgi:hypothetical protein
MLRELLARRPSGQYGHAKHRSRQAGLVEVGEGYATQHHGCLG